MNSEIRHLKSTMSQSHSHQEKAKTQEKAFEKVAPKQPPLNLSLMDPTLTKSSMRIKNPFLKDSHRSLLSGREAKSEPFDFERTLNNNTKAMVDEKSDKLSELQQLAMDLMEEI